MTDTAAPYYELVIPQGDVLVLPCALSIGGVPFDLTGYVIRLQVRADFDSEDTILDLASDGSSPAITVAPLAGTFNVTIDGAGLDFEAAVYDMEMESPAGVITRLAQGAAVLDRGVTR